MAATARHGAVRGKAALAGGRAGIEAPGARLAALLMMTTALAGLPGAARAETAEAAPGEGAAGADPLRLAQAEGDVDFAIPAQGLAAALAAFGAQAGWQVSYPAGLADGLQAPAVTGAMPPGLALDRLLEGSGIAWHPAGERAAVLERVAGAVLLNPVTVEGTADPVRFGQVPDESGSFVATWQSSATKTPLTIQETPQAITVTTRESMDVRQVRSAASALELTAGVVSSGTSGVGGPFAGRGLGEGESFNMRGQELNGFRDIRVDGFAIPSSVFDLAAYERIEAVKGPSSSLYGQGSLGGFINMVRKKPLPDFQASAALQAGSWNTRRGEADITGAFDDEERLLGRFTAAYDDSESFIDTVETRVALVAPSLEARIGEHSRALVQLMYQEDTFLPSRGVPLRVDGDTISAPEISRSIFVGTQSLDKSGMENFYGSLQLDHEISDRWLATVMLQKGHQEFRRFFDSYGVDFSGLATGNLYMYADRALSVSDNWAGELRLDGTFDAMGQEHNLLMGVERNKRDERTAFGYTYLGTANLYLGDFDNVPLLPGGAASQTFDFDANGISYNTSIYGQVVLSPLERTHLLAGVRYDWSEQKSVNNLASTSSGKNDQALTFRLGVTQDLTDAIVGYATYAQSFNPVDSLDRFGNILDPEEGQGYEAGLKGEWLDGGLTASVALFLEELDNQPITDPLDINFSVSGGLQRIHGLELEAAGNPYAGVTVGAAAAWIDAKFVDPLDTEFGLVPYGAVNWHATVYGSYELQRGPLRGLALGATVAAMGDRSGSFSGAGALFGDGSDEIFVEGYERVDLYVDYYGLPGWTFSLQLRNALDAEYIEIFRDVSGNSYFGAPRSILLRASADF